MTKHRVLLVDDQPIYRAGLKALMQTHPAVAFVDEAASATEALTQFQGGEYSVLVTDLQVAQESGFDLIALYDGSRLHQEGSRVVDFQSRRRCDWCDTQRGLRLFTQGGLGSRFTAGHGRLFEGRAYLHSESAQLLFRQMREESLLSSMVPVPEATAQEIEIVVLMCKGKTLQEISQILFLTTGTIKTHMRSLYQKWGVNSRTRLIAKARELHLNEP